MTVKWSDDIGFPLAASVVDTDEIVGLFGGDANGKVRATNLKAYVRNGLTTDSVAAGVDPARQYYADSLVNTYLSTGAEKTLNIAGINSLVVGDATAFGTPENGLLRMNGNLFEYHNGTDYINPLARANHTGTQLASTISDFASAAVNALAATTNTALLGAQYGAIEDSSIVPGQINLWMRDTTNSVNIKWRKQDNTLLGGTIPLLDAAGGFSQVVAYNYIYAGLGSRVASAILQADANDMGFLKPRVTTAQKLGIVNPAVGLQVYDTDLLCDSTWNGTTWDNATHGGGDVTGSATWVGYFTGTNVLGGSNDFTYNPSVKTLTLTDAYFNITKIGTGTAIEVARFSSDSSALSVALRNTSAGSWKSFHSFLHNSDIKFKSGVDYFNNGTNTYFIEDATAASGAGAVRLLIDANGAITNGGFTADASACFELQSTTKGALLPRLTTVQMGNIASPAEGLLIFNDTLKMPACYATASWRIAALCGAVTTPTSTYIPFFDANGYLATTNNFRFDGGNRRLGIGLGLTGAPSATPEYPLDVYSSTTSANAIVSRFTAEPGSGATSRVTVALTNNNATNKSVQFAFYRQTTQTWSMGCDLGINGGQTFYIYDNVNARTAFYISESGHILPGETSARNGTTDLGSTTVKFKDLYLTGVVNPSDTRLKTDIESNLLGKSTHSMATKYNNDILAAIKGVAPSLIRYKYIDVSEGNDYDVIGFDARALYEAGFPAARAYKDGVRLKFSECCTAEQLDAVDTFAIDSTQTAPFLWAAMAKLIEKVEAIEAQVTIH